VKLLTFLGRGRYEPVRYFLGEQEVESPYVAVALSEIFNADEVLIFATPEAREAHGEALEEELRKRGRRSKIVDIDLPRRQEDVWAIFEKIVDSVEEGESVIVDITHAFRHIPFLSVPAILFLREFKGVDVKGIYYGAFEAKSDGRAPVFNLTSLIEAIEFFTGLRDLKYYGGVDGLVKTVRRITREAYTRKDITDRPKSLSSCANTLENLALQLFLNQIPVFMKEAEKARAQYPVWKEELVAYLPPVKMGLNYLEEFLSLGCPEGKMCLEKQLEVAEYQVKKKMYSNAVELLREIIVNYVLDRIGWGERWLEPESRRVVEDALNYRLSVHYKEDFSGVENIPEEVLNFLAENDWLVKLWARLKNLRNAVAHAGMGRDAIRPERGIENLKGVLEELKKLI